MSTFRTEPETEGMKCATIRDLKCFYLCQCFSANINLYSHSILTEDLYTVDRQKLVEQIINKSVLLSLQDCYSVCTLYITTSINLDINN